jgi:uncharacterized protein YndB with AHSA1/START domain/DNA-binding transcriptional ArsR family regulator
VNPQQVLAALAEPSRLRIVELLAAAPRTVGEIALVLDARQPQTTKHLQTLEAAGLITIHRLGKRRVASLRRETLRALSKWLATLAVEHPSEPVLGAYERAIAIEQATTHVAQSHPTRSFELHRSIPAPPAAVWQAWTTPDLARQWWSPAHFEVVECNLVPVPGGTLRIVIQEGDGARYTSTGQFLTLDPHHALEFSQSPLGPDKTPVFEAHHTVTFTPEGDHTALTMTITVSSISKEAAPTLAGIPFGWEQCLDKLTALLTAPPFQRNPS